MEIPQRVREGLQILAEDALIVVGFSLAAVGVVELSGWSSKELLQGYTPLLLAMFSIIVTVSALRLSIKEGRERAERERNDAVRPILIMSTNSDPHGVSTKDFECFPFSSSIDGKEIIYLENAGLGAAINIEFAVNCEGPRHYKVYPYAHKLKPDEKLEMWLSFSLPDPIQSFLTRCEDVYGNHHYSIHRFDSVALSGDRIWRNDYLMVEGETKRILERAMSGKPWSRLARSRFEEEISVSQTIDPEGDSVTR